MAIDRDNQGSVAEVIQSLFPDDAAQRCSLNFLADSIAIADALSPDRWGLTLSKDFLRLNVGKIEVLAFFSNFIHCLLDLDTLPEELREDDRVGLKENENDPRLGVYKSVPCSMVCDIFDEEPEEILDIIKGSHRILIENAARTGRNPMTKRGHSPTAIDYIASYLGRDLPQPDYCGGERY
ncbi:MAG: hypothetical protein AB1757_27395 [Acidobacteriota bacterium]